MNDHAYDISYIEAELIEACMPAPRAVKAPGPTAVPSTTTLAAAQEAMARELLAAADIHEALIQQYLRMSGNVITSEWSH